MTKRQFQPNAKTREVQDDLEKFLGFCRDYGYRYDPAELYNWKSYAFQQYNKFLQGKNAKNMWDQLIATSRQ